MYYWAREAKNSNAELDYLIEKKSEIVPIEVKSGPKGRMKSLVMFLENYKIATGIKISQEGFNEDTPIMSLPFYAIESFLGQ